MRNSLKIGVVVLVVAAFAVSGIALALDDDPATGETVPGARIAGALAPLVEDGTLTQAQADAVGGTLAARGAEVRGPRGQGGQQLDDVAGFLGVTADEVRDALIAGSTLAEVADANGSSGEALAGHLTEQMRARVEEHRAEVVDRLDQAVEDGDLTRERADEHLNRFDERTGDMEQRITDMVNGERSRFGHREGHGRAGRGRGGGGFGPGGGFGCVMQGASS